MFQIAAALIPVSKATEVALGLLRRNGRKFGIDGEIAPNMRWDYVVNRAKSVQSPKKESRKGTFGDDA